MRVALLAHSDWLDEELATFRPLVVGLMDENVRVVQVLPADFPARQVSAFGERVTWENSGWRWLRRRRIERLALRLTAMDVDLIHALDGRMWEGAARLSEALELPVVFTAGAASDIKAVERCLRQGDPSRMAFAAQTKPIADAIREQVGDRALVEHVPPGVHISSGSASQDERDPDQPLCAIVSGSGKLDDHYNAVLEAVRKVVAEDSQAQFFFDGQGADQHRLWQQAQKMGLLSNVSLVPRPLDMHEMLMGADVLLHPQALGRARGVMLQAMAHAVPVVACEDPWLDYLVPDESAWVMDPDTPEAWQDVIARLRTDYASAAALGERSQQWVKQQHLAASLVEKSLDLYRRLTGATLPFPQGGAEAIEAIEASEEADGDSEADADADADRDSGDGDENR